MEHKSKRAARQEEVYEQDMTPAGRPKTGKKPKNKNIKVTDEVHEELGKIGRLTEDYGDVVERLIRYYKEHEGIG